MSAEAKLDTLLPLECLRPGEWAEVADVSGETCLVCRLAELGMHVGDRVRMVRAGSPCLLQVGGCRLSLRAECATCILVRPLAS